MDVMPPKPPADTVKQPPKEQGETPASSAKSALPKHHKASASAVTHQPRPQGSGVALAITATVVIVLGLAAFFVYAYLRTSGISVF